MKILFEQKVVKQQILSAILFCAFILNGVNAVGAIWSFDFRMWQVSLFVIFLVLLSDKSVFFPKKILAVFVLIVLHSIAVTVVNGVLPWFTIVQIILVFSTLTILYSLVRSIGIDRVLDIYFKAACLLAVSVFLEEFSYLFFAYNIRHAGFVGPFIRASGLLTEPSQLAVLVAPAILYGLIYNFRVLVFLLVISVIISFSSLAYVAVLVTFFLYFIFLEGGGRRSWVKRIVLSLSFVIMLAGVISSPNVQKRLGQLSLACNLLGNKNATLAEYQKAAGTASTLIFNTNIALMSIENTYGLGVGFGSFRVAFNKYSGDLIDLDGIGGPFYNRSSGGNLLIRSLAETGVIGVSALLLLLLLVSVRYKKITSEDLPFCLKQRLCISSGTFLIVLVVFLLRKDMWFGFYLMLFVSIYIVDCRSILCPSKFMTK